MIKQFNFTVRETPSGTNSVLATVHVDVPADPNEGKAVDVINYLHSQQVKLDFKTGWSDQKYSNWGMEVKGGPRPVFRQEGDRNSGVVAYEQDFRLTRPI